MDDEVKDSIDGIRMSVAQSRKTISELIEMASQQASEQERIDVNITPVLEEVLFVLRNMINDTGAQVHSKIDDAPKVNFSIPGLKSLLQNLMSNSLKYRHPDRNPIITIESKQVQNGVMLSIADNGLGIDLDKDGEKLFSKFERIHTNAEGSGLGLSLIKSMVEERGERLKLKAL